MRVYFKEANSHKLGVNEAKGSEVWLACVVVGLLIVGVAQWLA